MTNCARKEESWIFYSFFTVCTGEIEVGYHNSDKCIQLFRERSRSGKVHATILKGIVGGFEFSFFQRNLKELARKAMEMCLRVLKESNKSRFDSYSVRNSVLIISHITFWDCRVHSFYDNLSRNSCIPRREVSRYIFRSTMNRH